jgi:hypothetical protein
MMEYIYGAAADVVYALQRGLVRERGQPKLTALAAASCPSLDQDPLANPSGWPGYLTFFSSTPYDDEPIQRTTMFDWWDEDHVLRSEMRLAESNRNIYQIPRFDLTKFHKSRYCVAYHYPVDTSAGREQVSNRVCCSRGSTCLQTDGSG